MNYFSSGQFVFCLIKNIYSDIDRSSWFNRSHALFVEHVFVLSLDFFKPDQNCCIHFNIPPPSIFFIFEERFKKIQSRSSVSASDGKNFRMLRWLMRFHAMIQTISTMTTTRGYIEDTQANSTCCCWFKPVL